MYDCPTGNQKAVRFPYLSQNTQQPARYPPAICAPVELCSNFKSLPYPLFQAETYPAMYRGARADEYLSFPHFENRRRI
eukprot:COSAG02_NODE_14667_length_1249_cov_105.011304_1_plen_78_part_10